MAITNHKQPSGYPSAHDSLWHSAVSDSSGLTNFKYIFDIYDASGTQLIRSKIYPDVTDGWGYFDAGSVVRNEISYKWFAQSPISQGLIQFKPNANNEASVTYTFKLGEEYNVGTSGITNINLVSGSVVAYNYLPPLWYRQQKTINDISNTFITNRPYYGQSHVYEDFWIAFRGSGSKLVTVKYYNANNVLVKTNTFTKNFDASNQIHQLNIGIDALNIEFAEEWFDGSELDGYYTVDIKGKTFRVNLKCITDYDPVLLHFMNAYGVFDTARFDCTNKLSLNITRKKYETKDVTFTGGNANIKKVVGDHSIYNESAINYAQDLNWMFKLQMNFPTDAEWEWLAELVYSPLIYMDYKGSYFPVTIKNTNYDYNKQIFTKLKTFEIDVEVNQKRNGFRR